MEEKIQGFVLNTIRYGDSSLIVKVFTLNAGLQSYMVKGVNGKKSKNQMAFFQPMTFLCFLQSGKLKTSNLAYLRNPEVTYTFQSIPMVMNKSAILLYLSELLSQTLTQQERNDKLYQFVFQSLVWLDLVDSGYANFPLYFTLELCRFLGFYPQCDYRENAFFDMMEGHFVAFNPVHPYYLDQNNSVVLSRFLNCSIDEMTKVPLTGLQRNDLLDGLLTFMRLHAPMVKGIQSHEILKVVLH